MLAISDFFNLHTLRPFALMRAPFASLVKFSNATWKIAQHNLKRMPKSGQLTRKHFVSPVLMCELLQKIRNHQVHRPNCDTIRSRNLPKALHHKLEEIGCRVSLATSQSVLNYWRNDLEHCLLIFLVSCLLSCRINWRNIKCRVELCGKNKKKSFFHEPNSLSSWWRPVFSNHATRIVIDRLIGSMYQLMIIDLRKGKFQKRK